MDAHLRAALRRNLDFAAIRVTIAAEQRVVAKRALRTLRSRTTVRRDLDGLQNVRADECAQRAALRRGIGALRAASSVWRHRYARASRHAHLMALMRGFHRMKKDLETAKRAERAARRRAARQHRTLLQLHARLLLARWRMDSAALACAISRGDSHGIRRRLRCRSALQKWREGLLYAGVWGALRARAAAHRAALMRASGLALLRRRLRERADARRRLTTLVRRVLRKKQKGALRAWRGVVMRASRRRRRRRARCGCGTTSVSRGCAARWAIGRRWRAAYGAVAPTPAARCGSGAAPHARHSGFRWGGASRRRAARACGGGHWSRRCSRGAGSSGGATRSRRAGGSPRAAHRALMRKWFRRCRAVTAYIGAVRAAALTLSEALSSYWLRRGRALGGGGREHGACAPPRPPRRRLAPAAAV